MSCWICLENTQPLINTPCACRGELGSVHHKCILNWIAHHRSNRCRVCNQPYQIAIHYQMNPIYVWSLIVTYGLFATSIGAIVWMLHTQRGSVVFYTSTVVVVAGIFVMCNIIIAKKIILYRSSLFRSDPAPVEV